MKGKFLFTLMIVCFGFMSFAYAQNMAVMLDGVNDHIDMGNNKVNTGLDGASGITFTMWINPTSLRTGADTNRNVIIDFPNNGTSSFLNVYLREGGIIRIGGRSRKGDSFLDYVSSSSIITTNKWQYLAGVLDFTNKKIHLYLDGNLVDSVTKNFGSPTYVADTGGREVFGASTGLTNSQFFHGMMDEIKIWNYPLNQLQIQSEKHKTYTASTIPTGMIAYWNFQEGTGTIANDLTTNNFTGELTNGAYFTNSFNWPVIVHDDGTATNGEIEEGYPIPPGLLGPDDGLPAVLYTLTADGVNDVIVYKPEQYTGDWWCWLDTPVALIAAENPINSNTPFVIFEAVNFGPGGSIGVIINDNSTLPVELSSFTATVTSQYFVQLHWVTQSETDALGYIVFRSEDNNLEHAQQVSPLIPATNTSSTMSYMYTDEEVTPGTWYYWLQSLDMSGAFKFHGPVFATVSEGQGGTGTPDIPITAGITSVFPNPFNPSVTIGYILDNSADVRFRIYNARGQLVHSHELGTQVAGNHKHSWDASGLPTGIYMIRMQADNKVYSSKAVLSK